MIDAESEYLTIMFAEVGNTPTPGDQSDDPEEHILVDNGTKKVLDIIEGLQGQVINGQEGRILAAFETPDLSVDAAITVMEGLENSFLSARIGCQTGYVWKNDDRPAGAIVDVAEDIGRLARPNQILLGQSTKENLSHDYRMKAIPLHSPSCNRRVSMNLYEMDWRDIDQTQIVNHTQPVISHTARSFILQFRNRIAALNKSVDRYSLGRDEECDIHINSSAASRKHALLKYESGRAILIDQSTNGTYIHMQAGGEIYLHNNEQILLGDCIVSLGRTILENEKWLIHITCKEAEETDS